MKPETEHAQEEKQAALQTAYLGLSARERQDLVALAFAQGITVEEMLEHAAMDALNSLDRRGHVQCPTIFRDF